MNAIDLNNDTPIEKWINYYLPLELIELIWWYRHRMLMSQITPRIIQNQIYDLWGLDKEISLTSVTVEYPPIAPYSQLRLFALSYNSLRIMTGLAGVGYST